MATTFRLQKGVNRVRVGSIVVDEKGYKTNDALELRLLSEHPALVASTSRPRTTPAKPKAKASKQPPAPAAAAGEGASS